MRSRSWKESHHALQLNSASCVRSVKSAWELSSSQLAKLGKAIASFRESRDHGSSHDTPTSVTKCFIYVPPKVYSFSESGDDKHPERNSYQEHEKQRAPLSACSDTLNRRDSALNLDSRPGTEILLDLAFDIRPETSFHDEKSVRLCLGSSRRPFVIHEEKHRQSQQGVMGR